MRRGLVRVIEEAQPPAPSGFDAMGKPVPKYRKSAAYRHVKLMAPEATNEEAWSLVARVADRLERDDPYGAMREATDAPLARDPSSPVGPYAPQESTLRLDETGGYRLLSVLLCEGRS